MRAKEFYGIYGSVDKKKIEIENIYEKLIKI